MTKPTVCPHCGGNEFYKRRKGPHTGKYCFSCDRWICWVRGDWKEFNWPIGSRHKGEKLIDIAISDPDYIDWAVKDLDGRLQQLAKQAQDFLRKGGENPATQPLKKFNREPRHEAQQTDLFGGIKTLDRSDAPW